MSISISSNPEDELNGVTVKQCHPLRTLKEQSDDDVVYVHVPYQLLEELTFYIQRCLKEKRDIHMLWSGDIMLRHGFSFT